MEQNKRKIFTNTVFWGFILWLFGYALGIIFFAFVPKNLIGFFILPLGIAFTLWVLIKKIKRESFGCYIGLGVIWMMMAAALDYLFIVKLFKSTDYYKLDVYIYYALTLILPIIVGCFKFKMMKTIKIILIALIVLVLAVIGLGIFKFDSTNNIHDATYLINGQKVTLKNGASEIKAAPNSEAKIITRYFGNEVKHDLNGDGREDSVFILTQETGGSGIFYYVVASLNTVNGPVGSEGLLLGDRIAPQTTEIDEGNGKVNVIVVNYADRKVGESFATPPSVGKSIWLKLDPKTMQFGEVAQNFEGESSASLTEMEARKIARSSCIKGGESLGAGIHNKGTKTWWYDANLNSTREGCNPACVVNEVTKTAEINWRCTGLKY